MSVGCPVITSREASLPEICGDAALYCDWRDPGDIAATIRRVCGDAALRSTLATRGLARARRFTWDVSADRFVNILREIDAWPS
jgi:glycosyltransferase involved in cell wall biosynthesis